MNDSVPANQISSFVEPRYGEPIDTANGCPGGETKAARAFRCYIKLGRCLSQSESVGEEWRWVTATCAAAIMREIVHLQAGQCGNQIGAKVRAVGRGWRGVGGDEKGGGAPGPAAPDAIFCRSFGR